MKKTLKRLLTTTALAGTMLSQSCLYRAHIVEPELFNDIRAGKYGVKNRKLMYCIELERKGYDAAILEKRGWAQKNHHMRCYRVGVKDKGGVWMEINWDRGEADYGQPFWELYKVYDIRIVNGKMVRVELVRNKWGKFKDPDAGGKS